MQTVDNLDRLINEGASRGLHKLFDQNLAALSIPAISEILPGRWYPSDQSDYVYVVGLLKWLTSDDTGSYRTRSAVTAQVATCLRVVGYSISNVLV